MGLKPGVHKLNNNQYLKIINYFLEYSTASLEFKKNIMLFERNSKNKFMREGSIKINLLDQVLILSKNLKIRKKESEELEEMLRRIN